MDRIIVGVDGSEGSSAALEWALAEAGLRTAILEVVHVWQIPTAASVELIDADTVERAGKALVARMLEAAKGRALAPSIETNVISGSTVQTLLRRAEGAAMVVVGARGIGGLRGLLIGSVGIHLVHHAPCTVVIVRS